MFFASFTIAHFAAIVVDYLFINKRHLFVGKPNANGLDTENRANI